MYLKFSLLFSISILHSLAGNALQPFIKTFVIKNSSSNNCCIHK